MTPDTTPNLQPPLCVDLDGTLIESDMMWESLTRLVGRNPLWILPILLWWSRGRAFLKRKLVARIQVDPTTLPYTESFLHYLREQKKLGRRLILASASDFGMVEPVAKQVGIFDEVLASDGRTNLRGPAKLKALTEKFGERGFDYAGNSVVDIDVWKGVREAIVVNGDKSLVREAAKLARLGPVFPPRQSRPDIFARYAGIFLAQGTVLAALAGLALALAFPKFGIAGLAWVAPALLAAATYGKPTKAAFRLGYVAGLVQWLVSISWLLNIPVTGYPILGWVALSAFIALYPAAWAWLLFRGSNFGFRVVDSWARRFTWSLVGAAAWVALEMVRARLFSGFPWSFLGVSQYKMVPLIQIASITGVYGVSFLVVWSSLCLFSAGRMVLSKPTQRYVWLGEIIFPMAVLLGLFMFGMARVRGTRESGSTLRVTMIQPAVPQTMIWNEAENTTRFDQLLALSESALTNQTDLLIWPEAALPQLNDDTYTAITNLVHRHRTWMIFGADEAVNKEHPEKANDYDVYNSAMLFDPDGRWTSTYRKHDLVVFGEYIPLVKWLPFIKWFTPIEGGFAQGTGPVSFNVERKLSRPGEIALNTGTRDDIVSARISTLICFEDTFPEHVRHYVTDDTDFLVNITNDGWFGEGAAQWQQAACAVFRAVENNVPLIRSCNTGLTCWVDSRGRIQESFKDANDSIYGIGALTVNIPLLNGEPRQSTYYNRHGDWFGWTCAALTGLVLLQRLRK